MVSGGGRSSGGDEKEKEKEGDGDGEVDADEKVDNGR